MPLGLSILSQIISVATNTFVGPVLATGLTLFYFDLRVRKEGYDIEWMMAAAGLAAGAHGPIASAGTESAIAATHPEANPPAVSTGGDSAMQGSPDVLSPGTDA
jgi:ApbE superfamily uncharacterized protein (UPF0280 family)